MHALLGEQQPDLHVVLAVARQPVELVDEDVLDVGVFLDAGEHGLQSRPIGGAGALAAVDELIDELHPELCGLASAIVALRLDREAALVVAGVGLVARRHAVIGQPVPYACLDIARWRRYWQLSAHRLTQPRRY